MSDKNRLLFKIIVFLPVILLGILSNLRSVAQTNQPISIDHNKICVGESTFIHVENSDENLSYQLYNETQGINEGSSVSGTGGLITFDPITPGSSGTYTYKVIATHKITFEKSDLEPTVALDVAPAIDLSLAFYPDHYKICKGETVIFTLESTEENVNYQLSNGPDNVGISQNGNGSTLMFSTIVDDNTKYKINAIGKNCALPQILSNEVTINVISQPRVDRNLTINSNQICPGEEIEIRINDSEVNVEYRLWNGGSNVGAVKTGNGSIIAFDKDAPTDPTLYKIYAKGPDCTDEIEVQPNILVEVNTPPDNSIGFSANPESVCPGEGSTLTLATSEADVTYQLYKDGVAEGAAIPGDGNPVEFPEQFLTATTVYSVKAKSPDCTSETDITETATVSYLELPTQNLTITSNPAVICNGETVEIQIENSEADVSYQLINKLTGETIGSASTGNNATLVIQANPSETITYKVKAVRDGCITIVELDNEAFVEVNPKPELNLNLSIDFPEICDGESAVVNLEGSFSNDTYQLKEGTTDIGIAQLGDGGSLFFPIPTPNPGDHTYTMEVTGVGCNITLPLPKTTDLKVHAKPNLTLGTMITPNEICEGESAAVHITAAQDGYSYSLKDISDATVETKTGDGNNLQFIVSPIGNQTYSIEVENTGCSQPQELNTQPKITVNPGPNLDLIVDASQTEFCEAEPGTLTITVKQSEAPIEYELHDGAPDGTLLQSLTGDGFDQSFTAFSPDKTTNYFITTTTTGCSGKLSLKQQARVTYYSLPNDEIPVNASHTTLCRGETTNISLETSEVGVHYKWVDQLGRESVEIAGTGQAIDLPQYKAEQYGEIVIKAQNDNCNTWVDLKEKISLDIGVPPDPLLHPTVDEDQICEGTEITVSITPTDNSASYQLFGNDIPLGTALQGTGTILSFLPHSPMETTIYRIEAHGDKCINPTTIPFTEQVEVHHPPLTDLSLSVDHPRICIGEEVSLSLEGSQNGIFYELSDGTQFIETTIVGNGNKINFPHLHPENTTTYSIFAHEEVCTTKVELNNTVQVEVLNSNPLPIESITIPAKVCEGGSIQIELPVTLNGMEYALAQKKKSLGNTKIGDGGSIQFTELFPSESTTYQVLLNSCVEPTVACEIPIIVFPNPELDIETQAITDGYDGSLVIGVNQGTPPFTYYWTAEDSVVKENRILRLDDMKSGEYEVRVRDANGCVSADQPLLVELSLSDEKKVVVNNTLTPNGDGINDAWIIHLHPSLQAPEVFIYNIYGQEIYHSANYDNTWKGTYNGAHLPNGAYYYLIKFKETDQQPLKGTISILGKY